jgi:predicted DNA binding CopG/RHH family protein
MQFDEYEQDLLEAVEGADSFENASNVEQEIIDAKLAAKNYLSKTRNINIRITEKDLLLLKRKSIENNIPYQTIVSSIIHQYGTNKLKINI